MAVYYKFKSAKDYDSIPIEGQFISVANLKERIFESKHLGRGNDFDLMVSNAQTDEEYVDEAAMIPKNTSVLIRRVPGRPRKPIVTERDEPKIIEDKIEDNLPHSSMMVDDSSAMKYPDESEWDEFGNDLYSVPEVHPQSSAANIDVSPANKADEESKIKALVDTPALDWNGQIHDSYGSGRGFGRGMGGRMMFGRGFGRGFYESRGVFEKKTPPEGYICHRCKVSGHFIQHCPTNGDPNYDIKRVKPPTGIPRSMLIATPDGSYALPSGAVAVLKPNEAAFEKEIEGFPSTRSFSELPPELRCTLCKEVMKDAVLTSKCCFKSFCDKCIRNYIITNSKCVCGATNILADDLLPNKTLRETISRILETTTSSTENAGSLVHVQDMESARHVEPRVPSPTLSATSKGEPKQSSADNKAYNKESEGGSELKAENAAPQFIDKKLEKTMDQTKVTPDLTNAKEIAFAETSSNLEETLERFPFGDQGKKKKKKKVRAAAIGAEMQWRNFQDFGMENFTGMPMAPVYNPYWGGGMPIGIDGFMQPVAAPVPYMGYAPNPFDVHFGGIIPHDPYAAAQSFVAGFPQRDLAELGTTGFVVNQAPLSREEFEARKAEMRRRRGARELLDRERDKMLVGKETGSISVVDTTLLPKKRPRSEASGSVNRTEQNNKPEKQTNMDRPPGPTRDPVPPPRQTLKRKSSDKSPPPAGEFPPKPDRKQKASVFSRICFPAETGELNRKKNSSEPPNGLNRPVIGNPSSSGGGYEGESSDEERHFKRRSSARVLRERDNRVNELKRR